MSTALRFTTEQFDHMIERELLGPPGERRIELIEGELVEMSPTSEDHEDLVDLLTAWSFEQTDRRKIRVRIQHSLGIPELESVPYPDVVWVRAKSYRRKRPQPADVLLVIEVAKSSLRFDRGRKAQLYAKAGIADYWIVNVSARTVEVLRDPTPDGYQSTTIIRRGQKVSPLAQPQAALDVKSLFGK